MATPKTLIEAIEFFKDADNSLRYLSKKRWPNGVTCLYCEAKEPMLLETRRIWKCRRCRKQFSVKVGTMFEDSPLPIGTWLTATWFISNCKNGVSSYEIARDLKITQKSAWFMLQRIHLAMQEESGDKLSRAMTFPQRATLRNMHRTGTGGADKATVETVVERVESRQRNASQKANLRKSVHASTSRRNRLSPMSRRPVE